ncbi:variable surface protein [Plasmodium gonderi]|uniref:Variable surface protein n=1 Tax=Plasmodium gonderi TaxID=77519 RepID=A0A1Y1JN46_PLAGO|nr:variable surface protein [Plasmodium gonderi]GAW84016.1 variable surface protein [Plasmodium gonderi]
MVIVTDENENFDFTGIFPSCLQDYKSAESSVGYDLIKRPFRNMCILIETYFRTKVFGFSMACEILSHYLENINNLLVQEYKKRNCKYFNYKLKEELSHYKLSCIREKDCYTKMISIIFGNTKMSDVCQIHIDDLDDAIFSNFQNLNWLYTYQEKLQEDMDKCPSSNEYIKRFIEISNLCPEGNNSSFCKEVKKFKDEYMKGAKYENACSVVPKILYKSDKRDIRMVILIVSILTFTVLIIIFVIYKYTPYGSYVKPRILKLKKIWNNKNKEQSILMNSFEETYKNITDENYLISYKSLDY